ncbi:hypothetical protein KJY73_12315 [Bowmanella sp. Y26]|uniref:hypothetical protein n=1 Tax=Bowmanella yangjiangensis TaxID=2811230 RepID=UPI001BDBE4E9|nr:hypothetical protein [Bowmanella yangjiangensis]MBT1064365.1 hypothetical protein [Bowmanella yangjiangensis]
MNILLKCAAIVASLLVMQGCLSTERYEKASDLNTTDSELERLLIEANAKDDKTPKPAIELLAIYAYDAATAAVKSNEAKLALGYYRIAAIGFWRDDIAANNQKLFDVVNAAERVCDAMTEKAPDRDCFVIRFTPLLASLEEALLAQPPIEFSTATTAQIQSGLAALFKLGGESKGGIDFNNGALPNLINQAIAQQTFLSHHTTLNQYVCDNLSAAFAKYVSVISPYRENAKGTEAEDQLLADHPLYKSYRTIPGEAVNSQQERVEYLIGSKVASCKSRGE